MRARRSIAALIGASVLMLTGACGSKDDTKDESSGSPSVAVSTEPSAEPTSEPSASAEPSASESPSASSALGTIVEIELVKGKPAKLYDDVKLSKGDRITLKVTSDQEHEIHVHGYDKMLDLKPGEVEKLTFTADKTGSFLVEVEDTSKELFSIQVK